LIIIDSIQGIQGRMASNAESVVDLRPGDHAATIQAGLGRILPIIRKHKIAMIWTAHVRANLDMHGGHGPKTRMGAAWGARHGIEYYVYVNPNKSADGAKDWMGKPLENAEISDVKGNKDKTGKRIFVRMEESSMGIEGRSGEFLLDYHQGIVDPWAEIAMVGANSGVVFHPPSKSGTGENVRRWQFEEQQWDGWENFLLAVKGDQELQRKIQEAAIAKDLGIVKK
jgi:hypothetical protein